MTRDGGAELLWRTMRFWFPFLRPTFRSVVQYCLATAGLAFALGILGYAPAWAQSGTSLAPLWPLVAHVSLHLAGASVYLGWPIGYAMAIHKFVALGSWRGLSSLGARPAHTLGNALAIGVPSCALIVGLLGQYQFGAPRGLAWASELSVKVVQECSETDERELTQWPGFGAALVCRPKVPPTVVFASPVSGSVVTIAARQVQRGRGPGDPLLLKDAALVSASGIVRIAEATVRFGSASTLGGRPWRGIPFLAVSSVLVATLTSLRLLRSRAGILWPHGPIEATPLARWRSIVLVSSPLVMGLGATSYLDKAGFPERYFCLVPAVVVLVAVVVDFVGATLFQRGRAATDPVRNRF